ncbi:MAG: SDR family NAD(P)-dependent oxidoreductase, partial [Hyphomonadaceae bacterium]
MPTKFDLEGRRAIVTGGARGIGQATAELFLKSGGTVAIWDVDQAVGETSAAHLSTFGKAVFVHVDQANLTSVEAARDKTLEALGGADILVNNAGVAGSNAPV